MFFRVIGKHFSDGGKIFFFKRSEIGFAVKRTEFVHVISLSAEFLPLKRRDLFGVVYIIAPFAVVIEHHFRKASAVPKFFEKFVRHAVKFQRKVFFPDIFDQSVCCLFVVSAERIRKRRLFAYILNGYERAERLAERKANAFVPHIKTSDGDVVDIIRTA